MYYGNVERMTDIINEDVKNIPIWYRCINLHLHQMFFVIYNHRACRTQQWLVYRVCHLQLTVQHCI